MEEPVRTNWVGGILMNPQSYRKDRTAGLREHTWRSSQSTNHGDGKDTSSV